MYLKKLKNEYNILKDNIDKLQKDYNKSLDDKLMKEITLLKEDLIKLSYKIKKEELFNDYRSRKPMNYHLIDHDGSEIDVMLDYGDANYESAYKQIGTKIMEDEIFDLINLEKDKSRYFSPSIDTSKKIDHIPVELPSVKQKFIVFKVSNKIHIISSASISYLKNNVNIIKKYLNDSNCKFILHSDKADNMIIDDVLVKINSDNFIISGNVDEYESSGIVNIINNQKEEKKSMDVQKKGPLKSESKKDTLSNISNKKEANDIEVRKSMESKVKSPIPVKPVKRKKASKRLIEKYKELSRGKKIALFAAGAIMLTGIGIFTYHMIPMIIDKINAEDSINNISTENGKIVAHVSKNVIHNFINKAHNSYQLIKDSIPNYNTINAGDKVFRSANDSISGMNGVSASSNFRDTVVAVFDNAANKVIKITPDNIESVRDLLDDPNIPKAFGDSFTPGNVSGWKTGNGYKTIVDAVKVVGGRSL